MKIRFFFFCFIFLLAGCAQIPAGDAPKNDSWSQHQQQLQNLNNWQLTGKLAFITAQERVSLNLFWQQSDQEFQITLTNFVGLSVLDVKKDQSETKIIFDGKTYYGDDTETLIEQLSGFVIPIDVLQQWIKGNPTNALYQLNENNQLLSLNGQDKNNISWSIDYADYKTTEHINLPHKLQLKRPDLRLKFAISKWVVSESL
ncbi:lipoprotein insertase outer membrane protein LolB [Psychromonas aquimarina]|uniref:lipoprotein insertase outer membrane protein LolB n=1 Tax=Psychromonas aquimarina TaxID=444919 RepID=UPI0003FE4763|nr:lipoprotein insertase outer membrane protein LolB [Psychromonas aquimarina]